MLTTGVVSPYPAKKRASTTEDAECASPTQPTVTLRLDRSISSRANSSGKESGLFGSDASDKNPLNNADKSPSLEALSDPDNNNEIATDLKNLHSGVVDYCFVAGTDNF
jgi:hypothetical protein